MNNISSQSDDNNRPHSLERQLKILLLSWEYPPNVVGGLSRHVHGLAVQWAKHGHEVHVITAANGSLPLFERDEDVNIHRVYPLNNHDDDFLTWIAGLNLAMTFKAEKLAVDIHFDIIHAHEWLVGTSAIILKDLLEIPLLSTIHATEYGRNNGIHTDMQRFIHEKELQLMTASDQLIVCSEYMRDELSTIFQVPSKKMAVIPNGIEPLTVKLDAKEIYPFINDKKYVFSVGRIVKEKGFETIIEAAAIVKETGKDIYFIIAGKGPMLERYRQIVAERQLDHYIAFIGYVTDEQKNALLEKSEVAVFPSLYEPFGIVALEAMLLAKPTIVSNTGGLKGIVKHLQTGLIMVPGDAQSLLENIELMLWNPKKAFEIGQTGKLIVTGLYSWKRIAAQTLQIIEDTLLNKRVTENKE